MAGLRYTQRVLDVEFDDVDLYGTAMTHEMLEC